MIKEYSKEEQNEEIAKMIKWEKVDWFRGNVFLKPHNPKIPFTETINIDNYRFTHKGYRAEDLKFDSDANWQDEAIKYVQGLGYSVEVKDTTCRIYKEPGAFDDDAIITILSVSRIVSTFLALFALSQRIKSKK